MRSIHEPIDGRIDGQIQSQFSHLFRLYEGDAWQTFLRLVMTVVNHDLMNESAKQPLDPADCEWLKKELLLNNICTVKDGDDDLTKENRQKLFAWLQIEELKNSPDGFATFDDWILFATQFRVFLNKGLIEDTAEAWRQYSHARIQKGEALSEEDYKLIWLTDGLEGPVVDFSTPDCFPSLQNYVDQVMLLVQQLDIPPENAGEFKHLFQQCYSLTQTADDVSLAARMLERFPNIYQAVFSYDSISWQKHTPHSWLNYVIRVKIFADSKDANIEDTFHLIWLTDWLQDPGVVFNTPSHVADLNSYVLQFERLALQQKKPPTKNTYEYKKSFQLCYSLTQTADDVSLAARMLERFPDIYQAGYRRGRDSWGNHTPHSWLKYVMKVKTFSDSKGVNIDDTFHLIWLTDGLKDVAVDFSTPESFKALNSYVVQVRELASRLNPQPQDEGEFKYLFELCYPLTKRAGDVSLASRMLETFPTQEGGSESRKMIGSMLEQFSTQTADDVSLATRMMTTFPDIYQADFTYHPLYWLEYVITVKGIADPNSANFENTFYLIWLTDELQVPVVDFSTQNCTDLNMYLDQVMILADRPEMLSTDPNEIKYLFQSCYSYTQTADQVSVLGDLAIEMQGKFRHIYRTDFKNDPCRWLNYVIRVKTIAETHSNSSTADFKNLLEACLRPTAPLSGQSQEQRESYQLGNLVTTMRVEFPTIYRIDFRNDPCLWLDYVIKIKEKADSVGFDQGGDYTPLFQACLGLPDPSDESLKSAIQQAMIAIRTRTPEEREIQDRITELEQYAEDNFKDKDGEKHIAATTMVSDLREKTTEHFSKPIGEQKTSYEAYNMAIDTIVNDKDSPLAAHRDGGWKKLAYNVVCAVAGLGIFYGLYCFATKSNRSGSFFLSPNTESMNIAEEVHDTVGHYSPGA